MDVFAGLKSADFFIKLLRGNQENAIIIHSPKEKMTAADFTPLPRISPELAGVSSEMLLEFYKVLCNDKTVNLHSVIVAKGGKVISEGYFAPYNKNWRQAVYSVSKSVTSAAVGFAISEGLLSEDEKIVGIFPDKLPFFKSNRLQKITVKHLLTMTSGISFNEAGVAVADDFIKSCLESEIKTEPGEVFNYNSLNTYLLSAAVVRKSGMPLVEYLKPRLFEPLGISNIYWETCPKGIEKGGWGLYLTAEEILKIGLAFMPETGIIPEPYREKATTKQVENDNEYGPGYGYQIWSSNIKGAFGFNGVFGQAMLAIPDLDIAIAVTAGSDQMFFEGDLFKIITTFFGDGLKKVPRKPFAGTRLKNYLKNLRLVHKVGSKEARQDIKKFGGAKYTLKENKFGFLPFIEQAVHGNFSSGITEIDFVFEDDFCTINFAEAGNTQTIKAGYSNAVENNLTFGESSYAVAAECAAYDDEDKNPVLKLYLSFLETPCTRIAKFYFYKDTLKIKFDEKPSVEASVEMVLDLVGRQEKLVSRVKDGKIAKYVIDTVMKQATPELDGEKI